MSRAMKNSGIPWIGEIPEGWKVERTKNVLECGKEIVGAQSANTQLLSLTTKGIRRVEMGSTSGKVPDSYDTYQVVHPGNMVFCLFDLDCSAVFSGVSQYDGMISPAYKVTTLLNNHCPKFYGYWFDYIFDGRKYMFLSKNIRYSLTYDEFAALGIVSPPYAEQQAIADFLDKKCAEIDQMVALQEKFIEELKAYKQSLITETVTKGLNPNAPMKDSGVEWIGEIPEGWKIMKLAFLTSKIGSGSTPTGGANVYLHDGIKFLRSQNIYFEGLELSDVAYISEEIDAEMKGTRVQSGDVLLNITGGSIGRCYFVDDTLGRANVNQHVSIIRPKNIRTKYLKYQIQSFLGQHQIAMLQTGGNREGLSATSLSNFKILYPDFPEQQAIADYLDKKCAEIDQLIAVKQKKADELKEYKKSIIYEYVTGKRSVCE